MAKLKKLRKDITGFTGTSIGLGVGAGVVGGLSTQSGHNLGGGIAAVGGFMPVVGTTMMAGHALRGVKGISKAGKRKKRRR